MRMWGYISPPVRNDGWNLGPRKLEAAMDQKSARYSGH